MYIHSDEGLYFTRFFSSFFIRYVSLIAAPSTFGTVCIIIIYIYTRAVSRPFVVALFIAYIVVKSRPVPPIRPPAGIYRDYINIFFNPSTLARIKTVRFYYYTYIQYLRINIIIICIYLHG